MSLNPSNLSVSKHPAIRLLLICLGALLLRLALMPLVQHPGIGDSNHYYNLGRRLLEGHGFTIDYIWQYNNPPDDLVHPEDYWMPLNSLIVAASMALFGTSVHGSIAVFILIGSLVPLVAYAAARQFQLEERTALFCAAASAVLPEFVLNSLRTDTTMPNVLLVCTSILLLTHGLEHGGILPFVGSGLLAGLAYQVRSDSSLLLPMLAVTLVVYALWGRAYARRIGWRYAVLVPLIAIAIALPWAIRNVQLSRTPTTPKLEYMFYLTDFRQHFVYDTKLSWQTLLASQTSAQLLGKRLFEMAASLKIMYTTLDVFLPVAVTGGVVLLVAARDRQRWLTLAPTLILLGGVYVFYTILVPLKSEGGSFKKAYLTLIPLLLPIAGYALERSIADVRLRSGTMLLALIFTTGNAIELVRADARVANGYLAQVQYIADTAQTLPDTNGDGEIILMTQDPFMLRFVGMRSVMTPMEDRDGVLEVAQRYDVDYLLMPADRPSLDPLYLGTESDRRLIHSLDIPGTAYALYRFDFEAEP